MVKRNKWFVAYKKRGADLFDLSNLQIIEPEPDTYEADPFIISVKGKDYIFFELYDYNKGVIAFRELTPDGPTKPQVVLSQSYHLSFPAIFKDGDDYYMTPETVNNGQLELYRARNFPFDWELVRVIAKGWYDDPIHFKDERHHYILTTQGANNYRIFRSEALLGNYDLIYADDREQARSAGFIFELDGKMIRPTQNCLEVYGGNIAFYEQDFPKRLKTIHEIKPDWFPNLSGTHTFNFNDNYVVIDGRVPL